MDGTFLDDKGQFDMERLKHLLAQFREKGIYSPVVEGFSLGKAFS